MAAEEYAGERREDDIVPSSLEQRPRDIDVELLALPPLVLGVEVVVVAEEDAEEQDEDDGVVAGYSVEEVVAERVVVVHVDVDAHEHGHVASAEEGVELQVKTVLL